MKRKSLGLKIFIYLLIFIMMFSAVAVIVVYLKGINAQEEARQKALEQQAQYQEENDNTVINIPQIEVKSDTGTVQTIKIGTGEKTTETLK